MGRPPSQSLGSFDQRVRDMIVSLRLEHSGWGPKTICVELSQAEELKGMKIPKPSSIALFLKKRSLVKPYEKNVEMAGSTIHEAERAHHIWQIDGQGAKDIEGLGRINFLNVKDLYSKAYCGSLPAWARSHNGSPSSDDYQCSLRLAFAEFGLPEKIQSDRATVFYENKSKSPFPTRFHLWLIALGITMVFSRKRRPTDQACVERMHQTIEAQTATSTPPASYEQLLRQVARQRHKLNHEIPSSATGGLPPLVACPEAQHSGRAYSQGVERELMDLERVYDFLAGGKWYRKVGRQGRVVSLGGHKYYIQDAAQNSTLQITFDREDKQLVFSDAKGEKEITRKPIIGIDCDSLMGEDFAKASLPGFQFELPLHWEARRVSTTFMDCA